MLSGKRSNEVSRMSCGVSRSHLLPMTNSRGPKPMATILLCTLLSRRQKKGAVSLSLLRELKWSPGVSTPSERDNHRQVVTEVDCCERFPRKDPGVFDILGPPFSCDTTVLTRLLGKCAYGLPNRWGVQCSHLKKCERQAGTRCCHTRQMPLQPGTP